MMPVTMRRSDMLIPIRVPELPWTIEGDVKVVLIGKFHVWIWLPD